jgi:hypothetical protein
MGPIATAVVRAIACDADEMWTGFVADWTLERTLRIGSWPADWRDDAAMRSYTRYPVSRSSRLAITVAEAQWTP